MITDYYLSNITWMIIRRQMVYKNILLTKSFIKFVRNKYDVPILANK